LIHLETDRISLRSGTLRIQWTRDESGWRESVHALAGGEPVTLAEPDYHLRVTSAAGAAPTDYRFTEARVPGGIEGDAVELALRTPDGLCLTATYIALGDTGSVEVRVNLETVEPVGAAPSIRCMSLCGGAGAVAVRLVDGQYGGWSIGGRTLVVRPAWDAHASAASQMALAVEGEAGVAMACPAGEGEVQAPLPAGFTAAGHWVLTASTTPVGDPAWAERTRLSTGAPNTIREPRCSAAGMMGAWQDAIRGNDYWVAFGPEMGLLRNGPDGLVDLAANAQQAWVLYQLGEEWAEEMAGAVLRTLLQYDETGLRDREGPSAGVWWDLCRVEGETLRREGPTVDVARQALLDYFLAEIARLEKGPAQEMAEAALANAESSVFDSDTVEQAGPLALASAALATLKAWEISGRRELAERGHALFGQLVQQHLQQHEWGGEGAGLVALSLGEWQRASGSDAAMQWLGRSLTNLESRLPCAGPWPIAEAALGMGYELTRSARCYTALANLLSAGSRRSGSGLPPAPLGAAWLSGRLYVESSSVGIEDIRLTATGLTLRCEADGPRQGYVTVRDGSGECYTIRVAQNGAVTHVGAPGRLWLDLRRGRHVAIKAVAVEKTGAG